MTRKTLSMLQEFKQFLLRGNVVDLAVAVVIGAAFSGVVNSMVKDLITPLIAAIGGQHDFSKYSFTIHHSTFAYGDFLNSLISFMIIAAVIFFFVVKPINQLISLSRRGATPDPTTRKCPECMAEIPINAKRCMYCAQLVTKSEKK